LREELVKLARQKPRYGYRRLHAVLERRGQAVNVKRVYRLYTEQGLAVRRRKRKRLVREQMIESRLIRANQEWAMDFIVDGLANGRMVRILSVVDAFTRECLVLEADTSLGSGRVTRALDRLIEERGQPENVRSDNGPEFTSRRMLGWAEERKINLIHIQPGRPMQNGHVESFHGRLRDECLNANWFRTLSDIRQTLNNWRQEYNCERPHSSLAYRTPAEFSRALGYGDMESKQRFPHPHSPDYDGGEIYSPSNLNRETPATVG
jgi:putative transposase